MLFRLWTYKTKYKLLTSVPCRWWRLRTLLRLWGWSIMNRISALIKEVPQTAILPLSPQEDTVKRWPSVNQEINSHQQLTCWNINLGLPKLQKYGKWVFVIHNMYGIFVIMPLMASDTASRILKAQLPPLGLSLSLSVQAENLMNILWISVGFSL